MAIDGVINATNFSNEIFQPLISTALAPLMTIIKVIGVALFVYILYLVIKGILEWKRNKRIDITYEKVLQIEKKLDDLLKKKKSKK